MESLNNTCIFHINNAGWEYIRKIKKDIPKGLFVFVPLFSLMYFFFLLDTITKKNTLMTYITIVLYIYFLVRYYLYPIWKKYQKYKNIVTEMTVMINMVKIKTHKTYFSPASFYEINKTDFWNSRLIKVPDSSYLT